MPKKLFILLFVLPLSLFIFMSCSDKKIVATFNGGNVTQNELKDVMLNYNIRRQVQIISNLEVQSSEIDSIIESKLYISEAKKRGLDKSEEYNQAMDKILPTIKMSVYNTHILPEKVKYTKSDADKLKYYFLTKVIRFDAPYYYPKELRDSIMKEAESYYDEVKKTDGLNFGEVYKKATGYMSGDGLFSPFDYFGVDFDIAAKVDKMKPGDVELIHTPGGFILMYLSARKLKSANEIDRLYTNEHFVEKYTKTKVKLTYEEEVNAVLSGKEVKRNYELIEDVNNIDVDAVIVSYKDFKYTGKDFNDFIASSEKARDYTNIIEDFEYRINAVESVDVAPKVLEEYYRDLKIESHPEFKKSFNAEKANILKYMLMEDIKSNAIETHEFTEEDIRAEYDKHKMNRYYTYTGPKENRVKVAVEYELIKDTVIKTMEYNVVRESSVDFMQNILKNANIEYNTNNFVTDVVRPKNPEGRTISRLKGGNSGDKELDNKEGFFAGIYAKLFSPSKKKLITAAYKELDMIYAQLDGYSGKELTDKIRDMSSELNEANLKLLKAFDKDKTDHNTPVDAFNYYYSKDSLNHARFWLLKLKEVPDLDVNVLKDVLEESLDKDEKKWIVIASFGDIGDKRILPELRNMLKTSVNDNDTVFIIDALGRLEDIDSVNILEEYVNDERKVWGVRTMALEALKTITGNEYNDVVIVNTNEKTI